MKKIILIIIIFSIGCNIDQNSEIKKIDEIVSKIEKLHKNKLLTKIVESDNKTCGGALTGYFHNKKLVLLLANNSGEYGKISTKYFIDNNEILKIVIKERYADLKGFIKNHPNKEVDESKLKYIIENTIVYLTPELFIQTDHKEEKIITYSVEGFIGCGKNMIEIMNNKSTLL